MLRFQLPRNKVSIHDSMHNTTTLWHEQYLSKTSYKSDITMNSVQASKCRRSACLVQVDTYLEPSPFFWVQFVRLPHPRMNLEIPACTVKGGISGCWWYLWLPFRLYVYNAMHSIPCQNDFHTGNRGPIRITTHILRHLGRYCVWIVYWVESTTNWSKTRTAAVHPHCPKKSRAGDTGDQIVETERR